MMKLLYQQVWWLLGGPYNRPALWPFVPSALMGAGAVIALNKFTSVRGLDTIFISWIFAMVIFLALNYAQNALNGTVLPDGVADDDTL